MTIINGSDGIVRTLKANYYKMSATNILERDRNNFKAMGVLIEYETKNN